MAESAPSSAPPPKKKPRKTTTLPPPCEIEADAALREEAKKAKKKDKKPLTTKDKLASANAAKVRKEQAEKKAAAKGGKSVRANAKGAKPKNLMDIMRELGQMGSKVKAPAVAKAAAKGQTASSKIRGDGAEKGKAKVKESVVVRPTEKTKRMAAKQSQQQSQSSGLSSSSNLEEVQVDGNADTQRQTAFRLMDLPPELRQRIWHFVVVETDFFVYPAIDHEQPDLAMTSRQIRSEVLPIYYRENVFAIEVTGYGMWGRAKKEAKHSAPSLKPIERWAAAMATGNRVQAISKWAIVWREPQNLFPRAAVKAEDREIVVSIRYPKPAAVGLQDIRPAVEIHRHAFCLLESHDLFAPCSLHCYPGWLDSSIEAAERAEKANLARQMMRVASDVTPGSGSLLFSRCETEVAEPE